MNPDLKTALFIIVGTIGVTATVLALILGILWLSTFFVSEGESNEDIADDEDDDMYGGPIR